MIERGHRHSLKPISTRRLEDGTLIVQSQCEGGCGLEEQRAARDGKVTRIRFRFGGLWFTALDLLRVGSYLGVDVCETCGGEAGLVPCASCDDLGVTNDDGTPLAVPELRVV